MIHPSEKLVFFYESGCCSQTCWVIHQPKKVLHNDMTFLNGSEMVSRSQDMIGTDHTLSIMETRPYHKIGWKPRDPAEHDIQNEALADVAPSEIS